MKKKPKCKPQNYNCGKICISGRYICRVDGLKGQSVSIANKLVNLIKQTKSQINITQGDIQIEPDDEEIFIESIVDGNTVKTGAMVKGAAEDSFLEINFYVNGNKSRVDLKNQNTPEVKRAIIKQVIKDYETLFNGFEEGETVTAIPYNDDGFGNKRKKLYERMGFKPNPKYSFGRMIAIKKDGKLQWK